MPDDDATTGRLEIYETPAAAATAAAREIASAIAQARRSGAAFHLALAGGGTPRATYEQLAVTVPDWTEVHLWFGDERMVPIDSTDANARMVDDAVARSASIPAGQVHRVRTDLGIEAACADYATRIASRLASDPDGTPVFDLVILGLGEDAHVASLFPSTAALSASSGVCVCVRDAPKPPPERISLTLPVINAARHRVVLTTGSSKAAALQRALGPADRRFPASLLTRTSTRFIVDADAARSVPR